MCQYAGLFHKSIRKRSHWKQKGQIFNIPSLPPPPPGRRSPSVRGACCLIKLWLSQTVGRKWGRSCQALIKHSSLRCPPLPLPPLKDSDHRFFFCFFFSLLQDFSPRSWAGFLAGRQLNICKFCLKRPWFQLINLQTRLFSSPADIISVLAELLAAVRVSQSRSLPFVWATPLSQTLSRAALCCVVRALTGSWRSRCPGAGRSRRSWNWRTAGGWRARPPRCRQTGFLQTAARASHLDGTQEERFSQSTFTQQCLFSGFYQLPLWQVK